MQPLTAMCTCERQAVEQLAHDRHGQHDAGVHVVPHVLAYALLPSGRGEQGCIGKVEKLEWMILIWVWAMPRQAPVSLLVLPQVRTWSGLSSACGSSFSA